MDKLTIPFKKKGRVHTREVASWCMLFANIMLVDELRDDMNENLRDGGKF